MPERAGVLRFVNLPDEEKREELLIVYAEDLSVTVLDTVPREYVRGAGDGKASVESVLMMAGIDCSAITALDGD